MPTITRFGVVKNLTLDPEAAGLLPLLSQSYKAQGYLVSQLIRQEAERRKERAQWIATGKAPWIQEDTP